MIKRKGKGDAVARALKAAEAGITVCQAPDAGTILKGLKWATLLQLSC